MESNVSGGIVLIVDDTESSAAALEMACASIPGIEVSLVSSALQAVRILQEESGEVRAVVTDLQMPGMDGFDLIAFIRADRRYERVPVVVVSADTDPGAPERATRLGANAFFSKPCSPLAIRQKVEHLINENRGIA